MTDAQTPAAQSPDEIRALIAGNADMFVKSFREELEGPTLDFSRASLEHVEAFFGALQQSGSELPPNLFELAAAYVNEVARRQFGGEYVAGDADNPYRLAIGDPPSVLLHVHGKLRGRLVNGLEDNIPFYYDGIAAHVGTPGLTTLI